MVLTRDQLPTDIRALQDLVLSLNQDLNFQTEKTQLLLRKLYGRSSEKQPENPAQQTLPFVELPAAPTPPTALEQAQVVPAGARKPQAHGRRKLPLHLARHRIEHTPPEANQPCGCCGGALQKIGAEVREQLEFIPATLLVIEHARGKYACPRCHDRVAIAPAPAKIIEKGLPGPGLLADLITNKLYYHLPLYRQELLTQHLGWTLARSTQAQWLGACAERLEPLYLAAKAEVLKSRVLHTDDTPVRVLAPGTGKTREARFWVYVGDELHAHTVYAFTPNRTRDGPARFLKPYRGVLQADAYGGYDGICATGQVLEAACAAHARRKLDEAQESAAADAEWMLGQFGALYALEAQLRPAVEAACARPEAERPAALAAAFEARRQARQMHAAPVWARMRTWLEQKRQEALPKSLLGRAIQYALNQWKALLHYLQDGAVDIDNNTAENAIRPLALGRKNWLFVGSDDGGQRAAILFSLVETCKSHDVDPWLYLRDVLVRIETQPPGTLRDLLPDRWKHQHLAAAQKDVADLRSHASLAQALAGTPAPPAPTPSASP